MELFLMPRAGKHASPGQAVRWLRHQLDVRTPTAECWTDWPFGRGSDGRPYAGDVRAYRLILEWRDGPAEGRHALHSCDNPPCWNPDHLRWGTPSENVQEAWDRGRMPLERNMPFGEGHHNAAVTDEQMREILTRHYHGESEAALAREFGISRSAISSARHGRTWSHIDAPRLVGDLRGRNQFTTKKLSAATPARPAADQDPAAERDAAAGSSISPSQPPQTAPATPSAPWTAEGDSRKQNDRPAATGRS